MDLGTGYTLVEPLRRRNSEAVMNLLARIIRDSSRTSSNEWESPINAAVRIIFRLMVDSRNLTTPDALLAHRARVDRNRNCSPAFMLFGREPVLPLELFSILCDYPRMLKLNGCNTDVTSTFRTSRNIVLDANERARQILENITRNFIPAGMVPSLFAMLQLETLINL
ncbi:hypothetical protein L218DRAFT_964768 [Marasmius fiardii PR-910]|nr:hypothetical protein L218DRAFT_964768 [Marasmius fiardii PR-910]